MRDFISYYKLFLDCYEDMYTNLSELPKSYDSLEDMADFIYALRECERKADDLRKEIKKKKELAEKFFYAAWIKEGNGDLVRTEYCSAKPDPKIGVALPSKDSKEYAALLEYFGIPNDGLFSPHWIHMVDYVSELAAAGKPYPPGIDPAKTHTVARVRITRKKDLLDD